MSRVAPGERDAADEVSANADLARRLEQAENRSRQLERIIENVPSAVWETWFVEDAFKGQTAYVSSYLMDMTGYTREDWLQSPHFWEHLLHPEDRERALAESREMLGTSDGGTFGYRWITKDGRTIWVETHLRVIRDERGGVLGLRGVTMDVTEIELAEQERARLKEEVIQAQARALEELSTPLIPITDKIMVMPIIGSLDRARAEGIVESLLRGVSSARARFAIIDITGVPTMDTHVADTVLRAARGVQLLGASVVLTGIRPEVAQTLVNLGTNLKGIVTRGTLKDGIDYATQTLSEVTRRRSAQPGS